MTNSTGCSVFIALAILLTNFSAYTQSKLEGRVAGANNQPLAGATVLLLRSTDSALIRGSVTTINGRYVFEKISPGSYIVSASTTEYTQGYSQPLAVIENENKEMPPLNLSTKISSLKGVTVVTRKPLYEVKLDRMIINVANNITATGTTVLDVLERSPGVIVDRQNNGVSINGKDGVVVMINGRKNYMPISAVVQMLAGMPADNVEKLEIITTPPANFDAEGNAGYINIVLKKNSQYGTNGSFSLTAGYSRGLVTTATGNFNHRQKGWNLYGNYSLNRVESDQTARLYHGSFYQGDFLEDAANSYRDPVETISDLKIGVDYDLKKDLVIGALVSLFNRGWNMDAFNESFGYTNGKLDTIVNVVNKEKHPLNSYDINLNLQKNYKNATLAVNFDYMNYKEKNPVSYINYYYDGSANFISDEYVKSNKNTPVQLWVGTIDYDKKLGNKGSISAGVKTTFSSFTNVVEVDRLSQSMWVAIPELTATYFLDENISAAYANFEWSFNDKTKMKSGLRYEYTNSNLKTATEKNLVDKHYGKFFPSFFLSHNMSADKFIGFAYSRRITRPTFWNLAPFVIFMDPNTFFSGNPALQPAITDNANISLSLKSRVISFSYSFESSPITNFSPHVDPATNKQTLAAENQKNAKTLNLNLSLPINFTKWWNMQLSVSANYQELNGLYNNEPVALETKNGFVSVLESIKLPKGYSFSVSGFYNSGGLFGISRAEGFGSLDAGVQKKFRSQKSTLRLNYTNILNTVKYRFSANIPEKNLYSSAQILFSHPGIHLTFTHNFGSEKVKAKRDRSTGTEEEKSRLKF
jgi:hypothetical protein